ncbi:flagellar biosynthetic protein FliO [Paenibacillus sp. MMS18-CY102]|uniref:flagellar biosynthetic protein FliO n=1 Tax=Paenibacillus sp. MMS18-CY102 TaxID=2682849 RepID=UPI001365E7FD|nr:flagellar biosynthetic protein FliO [Paenibacillus sp. MMS18-CY102]MWC26556.1 flagellar protein [Paenibacillus sp. MMS18-CY102]
MKNIQIRIAALASAILPFTAVSAAAASEGLETTDTSPIKYDGSMTGNLVSVLIALAVIVGLIVLVIRLLSRRNRGWGANRALRTLGGVALGQHKSLQVVELAGKVYIVGIGEDVRLLDKIDDPEEASRIIAVMEQQNNVTWNSAAITDFMNKFRKRNGSQDSHSATDGNEGPDFERLLRKKLDEQSQRKQQVETLLRSPNQSDRLMDDE